ncbi:protein rhsD, truncation [Escherichia coli]|nr:type VI secretion system tip protein TssI/VgrG [Escherichia coli]SQM35966.1 protein rhsD, truncation [Escherichia coli]
MSGKPAARQGDMTQYGGPIVQGSAGVRIGAPTGVACSVCPGGMTSGNPVNPLLGAKVQPGETDLALPGPLPFILSRTYSSYRTKTPAPVGVFGPGWKAPSDIRLQIRDDALILNDNGGRSIHFEPLLPGEAVYSRSESMWLVRGGKAAQPDGHTLARLWASLPPDIRLSPHLYLATNSAQGPWWILGWSERVPGAEDLLPAPLPPYRVLTGMADRFGRTLAYRREAAGDLAGEITGVTDGAGREFRLVLTTRAQRAEEARKPHTASLSSPDSPRPLSASAFPDTLPGTEYGPDRGIRLSAVWLMHDPAYPENLPAAPLVCYDWTPRGELAAVYDRSGTQMRHFTYDDKYRGRMVGHRYAGRPEMRYRYDDAGRVVEQLNPAGLSYRYQYEQDRITVTDSLNRREVLHTEGGAGLKRVVKKELADGSVTHSGYDAAGRLTAQTDAAGRRTEYGLNVVSGDITDITTPDGRETKFYYNDGNQLTAVVSPDGLESRRAYDEPGRLVSETSRSGDVIRYAYDNPHSELPATTTDATGSTRQMTWSRYGQLLAFTDCSGYQTRYEYDRFGQMTAVRIVLTGHPQANLNREWQVVASELHGEQPQAVPGRQGAGTALENHFAVIPADRTWRPQPLLKPLVDGPQSAVVTGPAGEEIFCDEHGRVRVKFNWDRYNPADQDSSCWIRVAQAWAGTGFGHLAIPRVGQEVIVDFLNGDPDQPIIMGRTYHQENRTPGSLPGTKTQMTIRSKTYKGSGFNELKFDDATGKEQVYIHAQKNMNTEVLNNRTTDVINNHAETIGNNQMIAVTNNQIQTVGVNQIETVGSNQIINVGSVQVETIGLVRALTVGVAYQTTVGGIMNTSVALMQSSQIGLHKSLRVGLGYDVKVGNNVTFTVGKTKKDDTGQTAIYSAGEHLELCCGKARLVLTKDGQIFLNGTKIHLQGKEQVNGDSLLINWNCAASKSPPKTPDEKQDTPDMREY